MADPAFVSLAEILRARSSPVESPPASRQVSEAEPSPSQMVAPEGISPNVSHLVLATLEPGLGRAAMSEAEPVAVDGSGSAATCRIGHPGDALEHAAAVREARLFRAAVADAFDACVAELTRELAADVLGRELRLAPADIGALARRLVLERTADGPVRLRVAPADAHRAYALPVLADPELQPGDAILECRSGEIDARLGIRLEVALAAVRR